MDHPLFSTDITTEYAELLLSSINKKGDVMFRDDELHLDEDTARKVWERMLSINKDADGQQAFYYSAI